MSQANRPRKRGLILRAIEREFEVFPNDERREKWLADMANKKAVLAAGRKAAERRLDLYTILGFTAGLELRRIRKKHGVGRPPGINFLRETKAEQRLSDRACRARRRAKAATEAAILTNYVLPKFLAGRT